MSNPLSTVRQNLSSVVGDLIIGTFTGGSTSTGIDRMLTKADDYYNDHKFRCYIYAGTGIGEERLVNDWDLDCCQLTLTPIFTAAIDSTSKYELHSFFTEDEYRRAINLVIETLAEKYLIDITDVTTVLVASVWEYTLPTTMTYVHTVTTENAAGGGIFKKAGEVDNRDWELIASRKLKLHDGRYSITAGKDLRIEGQGRQEQVTSDSDIIYLPQDWVVQKAITFLPQNRIQSNKLDDTYRQALILSSDEPRNWPHPKAQRVLE